MNKELEYVCISCGQVIAPHLISSERRAYNPSEINARKRTEPTWRNFGSRTVIGRHHADAHGNSLQPERRALFARLNKIQGSLISSLERNYWEAKPFLARIARRLALPDFVQETAWKIYKVAARKKLTMGRSIEGFVAASLYAAIRIHEFPRLLEEITEISLVSLRNIHKSLALIVRAVLPELNLRYKPLHEVILIYRFGNDLKLSMPIQQAAKGLLTAAKRSGMNRIGKDPRGIAGAVLYLAAKGTEEQRTQSAVASVAHVTEVTLRTRAKQINFYSNNVLQTI